MGQVNLIRVAVVDHNTLLRESLCAALDQDPRIQVIWQTSGSTDAFRRLTDQMPDVILLDVEVSGRGAFEIARRVQQDGHGTRIIILTNSTCDAYIDHALRTRVDGYLLKGESLRTVTESIKRVLENKSCFSTRISEHLRFDSAEKRYEWPSESRLQTLTQRQLQILKHLAMGASVKDVAKSLHLTPKAVDSHKYRIMRKLGIHDRVLLARYAIREGLISVNAIDDTRQPTVQNFGTSSSEGSNF